MKRILSVLLILVIVAIAAGAIYMRSGPVSTTNKVATADKGESNATTSTATGVEKSGQSADAKSSDPKQNPQENEKVETNLAPDAQKNAGKGKPSPTNYGHFQPVNGNVNPQAASVLEALKTKTHSERLSVLTPPTEPFDQAAYEADKALYCNTVVPGRIFQTATPGPNVPALKPLSNTLAIAGQNDPVTMSVKAAPGSPVTYSAQDGGYFQENKLNAITVRADKDGMAKVTYVGGPGTIGSANVLSGSPLTSGQVRFKVIVQGTGVAAAPATVAPKK